MFLCVEGETGLFVRSVNVQMKHPPTDTENAYADYEETDPKVAEEILARRKGTTPGEYL